MVFGVPGYYFSQANYDMLSGTSAGSINLLQNNNFWTSMANSVAYMTPMTDATVGLMYPQFGIYGNYLLDPNLAISQYMQQQQFNSGWGGFNFNNLLQNIQTPWQPNLTNNNSSSNMSDDDKLKLEKVKDEIKYLTVILNEVKKVAESEISSSTKNKIKVALGKTSSAKTELERKEEILAALKDAYKAVDKKIVRKVMATMPEVKDDLFDAGYNFSINSYGFKPTSEKSTASAQAIVNSIAPQIAGISNSNSTSAQSGAGGLTSANIVNVISLWNDSHTSKQERSIIRAVTERMNGMQADKQKDVLTSTIKPMSLALMGVADNLLQEHGSDFDDATKKHLTKLKDNLNTAIGNAISKGCDSARRLEIVINFESLYLQIRKMSALSAQKKLEQKYKFIDNIQSGTSDDVFNDNLFQKATKEDLIKEGFTTAEADSSNITVIAPAEGDDDIDVDDNGDNDDDEPSTITPQFLKTDPRVEKQLITVNGYNNNYYKYKNKFYKIANNEAKEVAKPAGWRETNAPVANDNNGGAALPTQQELKRKGKKLTKIEVTLPNRSKKTIEGAKINQFGEFYEYKGKIYQVKDNNVQEREDVKKA